MFVRISGSQLEEIKSELEELKEKVTGPNFIRYIDLYGKVDYKDGSIERELHELKHAHNKLKAIVNELVDYVYREKN